MEALRMSLDQAAFAECLFFTDAIVADKDDRIRVVQIEPLRSAKDYSSFILSSLVEHVRTAHCLVVQWDGFVLDAERWEPGFLDYDYIGAPWPQFDDGFDVGNGGFSLRSRKLLTAWRDESLRSGHPEDVLICRNNRRFLEHDCGIRFADHSVAQRFSVERTGLGQPSFGFHGIFNMIPLLGADRFWRTYRTLDDPSTAFVDYGPLMRQLGSGTHALKRQGRLTLDYLKSLFG